MLFGLVMKSESFFMIQQGKDLLKPKFTRGLIYEELQLDSLN
ncbi:MAG: hypothetical protein RL179_973 [Planctomycetota bacterium]